MRAGTNLVIRAADFSRLSVEPMWLAELLQAWATSDMHAETRGHAAVSPMFARLVSSERGEESPEARCLAAQLVRLHDEAPHEYEAVMRTFKPWAAKGFIDDRALQTAATRLAQWVDEEMGE